MLSARSREAMKKVAVARRAERGGRWIAYRKPVRLFDTVLFFLLEDVMRWLSSE